MTSRVSELKYQLHQLSSFIEHNSHMFHPDMASRFDHFFIFIK